MLSPSYPVPSSYLPSQSQHTAMLTFAVALSLAQFVMSELLTMCAFIYNLYCIVPQISLL